jgi:hypothetical protein
MLLTAARLALLLALTYCLSLTLPSYGASTGSLLGVAIFGFIAFEALSGLLAYRRLCYRLGALHEIFLNADRFENLPFLRWSTFPRWALHFWWKPSCAIVLVRGLFVSLRGWWVLQSIYEFLLAGLLLAATTYLLVPDRFNWSTVPLGLAAVAVLASKRVLTIYKPEKYHPQG